MAKLVTVTIQWYFYMYRPKTSGGSGGGITLDQGNVIGELSIKGCLRTSGVVWSFFRRGRVARMEMVEVTVVSAKDGLA